MQQIVCFLTVSPVFLRENCNKGGYMNKFGPKAQKEVEKAVHEYKQGDLTIGKSNKKVKDRKQAVAIGLSQARKKGAKAPKK
jgi:hypothetical protein